MFTTRHFTATGFVINKDKVLLHWHPKVQAWLPPGGHIEENEDPVQAVLREIEEETGVIAQIVPTNSTLDIKYPSQVFSPFTIMLEDINDPNTGYHQHIDMIYFCYLSEASSGIKDGWIWVSKEEVASGKELRYGVPPFKAPPEDVRLLSASAFEMVEKYKDAVVNCESCDRPSVW